MSATAWAAEACSWFTAELPIGAVGAGIWVGVWDD